MKITENYLRKLIKEAIDEERSAISGAARDVISLAGLNKVNPELFKILYRAGQKSESNDENVSIADDLKNAGLFDGDEESEIFVTSLEKYDNYKYLDRKDGLFHATSMGPGSVGIQIPRDEDKKLFYSMYRPLQSEQEKEIAKYEGVNSVMQGRPTVTAPRGDPRITNYR